MLLAFDVEFASVLRGIRASVIQDDDELLRNFAHCKALVSNRLKLPKGRFLRKASPKRRLAGPVDQRRLWEMH